MLTSSSRFAKWLTVVPPVYLLLTRARTPRELGYIVATSLIPAVWVLVRLESLGPWQAAAGFALGYLAFASIYDIGYLANDSWDAAREPIGRRRLWFTPDRWFVVVFVSARLLAWLAIASWTGWLHNSLWLLGYGALVVAFACHNLLADKSLRIASFVQLATLRFILPILPLLGAGELLLACLIAAVDYVYLRTLSYMDSKDLLTIPGRARPSFGLAQLALLTPSVILLAATSRSTLALEVHAYFIAMYGAAWALSAHRARPALNG